MASDKRALIRDPGLSVSTPVEIMSQSLKKHPSVLFPPRLVGLRWILAKPKLPLDRPVGSAVFQATTTRSKTSPSPGSSSVGYSGVGCAVLGSG